MKPPEAWQRHCLSDATDLAACEAWLVTSGVAVGGLVGQRCISKTVIMQDESELGQHALVAAA